MPSRVNRASGATGYHEDKEVALMKRILMVLSVAALMGAMIVATAVPAFAQDNEFMGTQAEFEGNLGYVSCNLIEACYMPDVPLKYGADADVIGQNAQQNLPGSVDVIGDQQNQPAGSLSDENAALLQQAVEQMQQNYAACGDLVC